MQFERFYSLNDSVVGSFPHLHHLVFWNLVCNWRGDGTKCLETISEVKREGREERDRQENEGLGDRWGEKQSVERHSH